MKISVIFFCMSSERPSSTSVGTFFDLSTRRMTIDSPSTVGRTATRMSIIRPAAAAVSNPPAGRGGVEPDAPVLRLPPLGDVELCKPLQTRRDAGGEPLRD